jgi:CheY-like chemotaxis protein
MMPTVMIAEDDFLIADCLEEVLTEFGYTVCGIAGTAADAIALGRKHHPDLAVLDVRLAGGGRGTEVATALQREMPLGVLFATGNTETPFLYDASGQVCIAKPYSTQSMLVALQVVGDLIAGRAPPAKLPRGVQVLGAPRSYAA